MSFGRDLFICFLGEAEKNKFNTLPVDGRHSRLLSQESICPLDLI